MLTIADVAKYEKLVVQLRALKDEIALLSKSKPNDALNPFKLGFVNEKLAVANTILTGEFRPFDSFTTFSLESLPSYSDVVMVLAQYLACFERWKDAHVYVDDLYGRRWRVSDGKLEA
jgi:hypothetical protein